MATVSFCSQKGGVSKSSLARALAVEAARGGLTVKIGDLDVGQGTTVDWHRDRLAAGIEPAVSVQLHKTAKEALRASDGVDLLVLDGPARADKETVEIAKVSDLVALPTGASLDDLRPAVRTANSLTKAGIPAARLLFVLSRIGTDAEADAARAYIKEAGYRVAPGYVPERPAFRAIQNEGRAITEVRYPQLKSAAESVVEALVDAAVGGEESEEGTS
ncbi:ParA family protein [Roseomonas sp. E05]|uniref:ParA family protein n=1 Tax=Roseomonas sp. E05 TaxID=3046310 RepID=UPI0024BB5E88|nr:ParA family protein [Roseomonas sp. E05]MDJ0391036.1 ParA family protein [Roseomonas sp. E05]